MLSDMYISIYNNPSTTVIEDSTDVNEDCATYHDDSVISSTQYDYGIYSIDIQNLCVPHKKENISLSEYLLFLFIIMFEDNWLQYKIQYNILF